MGYGNSYIVEQDHLLGTLAIGYADGLSRSLSNKKAKFRASGKTAAIVGKVCMDMCMVDLSNLPNAQRGDQLSLFENQADVYELAEAADTIVYEILTAISERVKRVYNER